MRRRRLLTTLALSVSLLAGCGTDEVAPTARDQPTTQDEPGAQDEPAAAVRVVGEDEAQLHLWVSNQSFIDDPARITVTIDGIEVVDQEFDVEGQHNWQLFPIALPAGEHRLEVVAGDGTTLAETFRTRAERPRYAVVDYFHYEEDGPQVSWMVQDDPVAFA